MQSRGSQLNSSAAQHSSPSRFGHFRCLCRPAAAAESRTTTIYAFHTLSYISEGVIFVYCGLDALDPLKWQVGGRAGGRAGNKTRDCAPTASATLLTLMLPW